jgi:hypothetical protein
MSAYLQRCTAVPKIEPVLYSEPCQTPSEDVNQDIMVKVEEVSATEVEEGREPVTFSEIKAEHEVSCMSVCSVLHTSQLPCAHLTGACVTSLYAQ